MTAPSWQLPAGLADDIRSYEEDVRRFLAGDLRAAVFRSRRVPRGVYEQRQDGSYMVRVRVAGGTLTHRQISALAGLGRRFGSGLLHVTTRQDVQLHDVVIEDTPAIMRGLLEVGLTSKGGGGNTVRNVAACPFAGVCPAESCDVTPAALAVTEDLVARAGSYNLPRKYKIAFSGCAADCALAQVADLGFVAQPGAGPPHFRVFAGGGMGAHARVGDIIADGLPAREIIRAAEAVRRLFDALGDRANRQRARLRFVFERLGAEAFKRRFQEEMAQVARDGVPECAADLAVQRGPRPAGPPLEGEIEGVRCVAQRQEGYVAVPLHLPLGLVSADDFARLGELAERFSAERGLRTTRRQDLLLRFVRPADLAALAAGLRGLQADVLSAGALARCVACAGASTCRLGLCLSREAARACAEALSAAGVDDETLCALDIHINGCANACGQQPVGAIGLYGAARRVDGRTVPCYRVTVGGRCGAGGARFGVPVGEVPTRALPGFVREMVMDFRTRRAAGESFVAYVDRLGRAPFEALAARHGEIPPYEQAPDFYRDLGTAAEFSLAGRGAGECGAGVFEIIREDLAAARRATDTFGVVVSAARALLITRGIDTQSTDAVLREFEKHFVDTGLVAEDYRPLLARSREYAAGWQEALRGWDAAAVRLRERVELLHGTLDADLAFHPPEGGTAAAPPLLATPPAAAGGGGCEVQAELDLRGVTCPMNFVKARLRLEAMAAGEALALILDDGEPAQNVPASFRNEGQEVVAAVELGGGHWRIVVRKRN